MDQALRRWRVCLVLIAIMTVANGENAEAKDSIEAGKRKAAVCAGCHGVDGNATNPQYPKLAGQHRLYLMKAIRAYQSGLRKDPLMKPLVAHLSEDDIEDLATFYASQKQQ